MENEATVKSNTLILDVIKTIENTEKRIAVVISNNNKVLGTITDGDIRRYILKNKKLNNLAKNIMQKNPITMHYKSSKKTIMSNFLKYNIRAIPLVYSDNSFYKVVHKNDLQKSSEVRHYSRNFKYAFILAGGEGKRLLPLTKDMPKPMMDINGIPLIESQIRKLSLMNIKNIFISINYLGDLIKKHLGNGSKYNVKIKYIKENKKLGTAGPLSKLNIKYIKKNEPILVINGDVFTDHNFGYLYDYHKENNSDFTICAKNYSINIPYGVIKNSKNNLIKIEEKPSEQYLCNAGIYALNTKIIKCIPKNKSFDMNHLIDDCISKKVSIKIYPLHEYWKEIGNIEDLKVVKKYFKKNKIT